MGRRIAVIIMILILITGSFTLKQIEKRDLGESNRQAKEPGFESLVSVLVLTGLMYIIISTKKQKTSKK